MEISNVFAKYLNPVTEDSHAVNSDMCKECGGGCCKSMGCHFSPADFKDISVESIIRFIDESGCISIDWWDGDPISGENNGEKAFFLRIKNKNAGTIDPSFGGECAILTDNGCPLSFGYRPKGARDLIPYKPECIGNYSKQQCAIDWYPYQEVLREVFNYYHEKGDITDSFYSIMVDLVDSLFGY